MLLGLKVAVIIAEKVILMSEIFIDERILDEVVYLL